MVVRGCAGDRGQGTDPPTEGIPTQGKTTAMGLPHGVECYGAKWSYLRHHTSITMGEVEVEVVSETCLVAHDESTPVCERCNDNMEKHEMSGVPQLWRA